MSSKNPQSKGVFKIILANILIQWTSLVLHAYRFYGQKMMVTSLMARENQHYILAHYVFLRTFGTFVHAVFYNESDKMCYITPNVQYRQKNSLSINTSTYSQNTVPKFLCHIMRMVKETLISKRT